MTLGTALVPRAGEGPNPLIPVWAEILLQLLVFVVLVAIVVLVVKLLLRRSAAGQAVAATSGAAPTGAAATNGLTPQQAYETAYRFVVEAARMRGDAGVAALAASMQPVRDAYEGEDSEERAAWLRAVEETTRWAPLPRP